MILIKYNLCQLDHKKMFKLALNYSENAIQKAHQKT